MKAILANAIVLFTKYQAAKLTMENIDIQEFMYSEQQKRADFVDERKLSNNIKIDIESILEPLATVQKTISEYEQRPWERDIVLRVQRMGAFTTSASTHLYKSRVKMKELPAHHCRNKAEHRNTYDKSRQENKSECDHVFRKELYGNQGIRGDGTILNISTSGGQERYGRRIHRKYRSKRVATWYIGSDKGRVIVQQRQVARGHKEREYGCRMVREGVTVNQRHCVQVRRDYIGGGTGKDPNSSSKQQMVRSTQDRRSMAKAQAYPEDGKKISGMTAQKSRLESALRAEANHSTGKAKVASDDCSREGKKALVKVATETTERKVIEQLRKGKRKRVSWETKTTEDTNNGAKECSETTAKHMNEVAGTDKMCNDKHRQAKVDTEGTMKTSTSNGPMGKYLKGKGSVTRPPHTQSETPGTPSKRERESSRPKKSQEETEQEDTATALTTAQSTGSTNTELVRFQARD